MNTNLFTIVLLNYNQEKYIENAIKIILEQSYPEIQLIISDDSSDNFNKTKIEDYINKHKKKNIKDILVNKNTENLGTVANLNGILHNVKGKYVMFTAADDELENTNTISDIYKLFEEQSHNTNLLITQTDMYDENLVNLYYRFLEKDYIENYKKYDMNDYLNILCKGCFFPSGSTIYRSDFIKKKKFDENYKIIEDWPMYLYCVKNNIKMDFNELVTLKHRDGGISHSAETTPIHTDYIRDIYNVYEREIIPILNKLTISNRYWVVRTYKFYQKKYNTAGHNILKKNITYKLVNLSMIVYYNLINLKNSINNTKYIGYSIIISLLYYITNNRIVKFICATYLIIVFCLILFNIVYDLFEPIFKIKSEKIKAKENRRR